MNNQPETVTETSADVVRGLYDALSRGDIPGVLARLDPEVIIDGLIFMAVAMILTRTLGLRTRASRLPAAAADATASMPAFGESAR
jgi:hypothetical protein